MNKELLEENSGEAPEDSKDQGLDPSGKKGILKKILAIRKKIILILILLLILAGGGAGGWFFFFKGQADPEPQPGLSQDNGPESMEEEIVFQDILFLEPFEPLPMKTGSAMEFVHLEAWLELMDPGNRIQVYSKEDQIRKIVKNRIRQKTWLDLRSPDGKIKLKYGILQDVNALFPRAMVRNLYFKKFIMQ